MELNYGPLASEYSNLAKEVLVQQINWGHGVIGVYAFIDKRHVTHDGYNTVAVFKVKPKP